MKSTLCYTQENPGEAQGFLSIFAVFYVLVILSCVMNL